MEEDPNGGVCNLLCVYLGYFKQGKNYKLSVRPWYLSTAFLWVYMLRIKCLICVITHLVLPHTISYRIDSADPGLLCSEVNSRRLN